MSEIKKTEKKGILKYFAEATKQLPQNQTSKSTSLAKKGIV